jgi:L-seryl-tRNA(Ser) seleniumtransferase
MSIYERLGLNRVINGIGTVTNLGGSLMPREVVGAMREASEAFVDMHKLIRRTGEIVAELTGAEAGVITSGASAGLVLATAACMTGNDPDKMKKLPDARGMRNEVIVQRTLRTGWYRMLQLTGARLVEVGDVEKTTARQIEETITDGTAAIWYFDFEPREGIVTLEELSKIGKKHGVPVLVDAAAEVPPVENLTRYLRRGADVVVFSGGKGIQGPNDSGFVCGRRDIIEAISHQMCPQMGIGRAMKIGKEGIVGAISALMRYVRVDHVTEARDWEDKVTYMAKELERVSGVRAERVIPEAEMPIRPLGIPRTQFTLDEMALGRSAEGLVAELADGDPSIRLFVWKGRALINPQCLQDGEEKLIVSRIRSVLKG